MSMTKPTSEQVTFLASGSGAVQRTALDKFSETVSVKDFGAVGDGVANDSAPIQAAINAALVGGRNVVFPSGSYRIGTPIVFVYSGALTLQGDNATILSASGAPTAVSFQSTQVLSTTLAADITDGATTVQLTSVTGLEPGQILMFDTATLVESVWGYPKRAVVRIADVIGSVVYLSEPINFGFTAAETTVYACASASLTMDGISVHQSGGNYRFDLVRLQQCVLRNFGLRGYAPYLGDVLFPTQCYGLHVSDLSVVNGQYTINCNTNRNATFDRVFAEYARHPIDCTTWSFNVRISNLHAVHCQNSITCHPSFEVFFEDCTDQIEPTSGGQIALRCIGGGAIRVKSTSASGTPGNAANGVSLLSAYQYLGQKYDRIYEEVDAPQYILGAQDVRRIIVRKCNVRNVSIDGVSARVSAASVDSTTAVQDPLILNRVRVLSPDGVQYLDAPPDTFASVDAIDDITGITQANPAVVTAVAHGLSNGDLVRINGVTGMTQVNGGVFTVANVATDTFELSGIDSTGYSAYVSGGKVTLGRLAKTFDPRYVPGCGNYPNISGQMTLRKTGITLNPLTSVTIPVKIVNVMSIETPPTSHVMLTVRAFSSSDGCVVANYQVRLFTATTTLSAISSAGTVVPAIGTLTLAISNFRPHYATQVVNEGGNPNLEPGNSQFYMSFDVVATASATSDRIQYMDVEFVNTNTGQLSS